MKLTPDTLCSVGRALYGDAWKAELAAALGVTDRTMRRWIAGDFIVPDGVWDDIAALCQTRPAELAAECEARTAELGEWAKSFQKTR